MIILDNAAVSFENFFSNPYLIRLKALSKKYYTKLDHPTQEIIYDFPGKRSDSFAHIDKKLDEFFIKKVLRLLKIEGFVKVHVRSAFSFTTKDTPIPLHRDLHRGDANKTYAGVLYLNPNIKPEEGTSVEGRLMPAKFNRLVLYDGSLEHKPAMTFGTHRFNSRLVLSTFFSFLD